MTQDHDLPDQHITALVTALARRHSPTAVARKLGLSRSVVHSLLFGNAQKGTFARVRELVRARPDLLAHSDRPEV